MEIQNQTIKKFIRSIFFNGEPVELNKFIDNNGEYNRETYLSSLSEVGIKEIGKSIITFEIYIEGHGWFTCAC